MSGNFLRSFLDSLQDLLPIIIVVAFFQLFVLQQAVPDLEKILVGTFLVVLGLTFFIRGLNMALFPMGESIANVFARKGSTVWLLVLLTTQVV